MEFELDRTQMNGFNAVLNTPLRQEETLEMIVPDACPDILRVVETDGKALLGRKEAMDGRAEVSGVIRANVLYIPDGENGMRHLDVSIPFACAVEANEISPECVVVAQVRLCHADTRAMNPRKVLVRAEVAADVTVFAPRMERISTAVIGPDGPAVEQLTEIREIYRTACVQEKPFQLTEEVTLSSGKPAVAELLKNRMSVNRGDSKIIGNKLIYKGSVNISMLYRGEDNGIYSAGAELSFSQIMEVSGVSEEADCELDIAAVGVNCALTGDGEGRTISVELELMTQAVIREICTVSVLSDAYSTVLPLVCKWENWDAEIRLENGMRSQNVREIWETPVTLQEITDCRVVVGQVLQTREGEKLILAAQAEVQALGLDERGEAVSLQRNMAVPCALEVPEGCRCFCQCEPVGDVYATPASGGIEVRFSLDFSFTAVSQQRTAVLSELQQGVEPEEAGERPSLVLRRFESGERLWDVAKVYGTTIADIISANELDGEPAAVGKLLLIPRRR